MLEEHLALQARGTVQLDVAVLLFEHRNPALKLLLARPPDSEADRRIQHGRVPSGLQLRLILTREHPVLPREQARTVHGALDLLVVGMLDVSDALTDLRERLAVATPAGVYGRVDWDPERLKRREQHLGGRAGKLRCVR